MSDLEDDVLMLLIEERKSIELLKVRLAKYVMEVKKLEKRDEMLDLVWDAMNALLQKMLVHPEVYDEAGPQVERLKKVIADVIALDEVPLDKGTAMDAKDGERSG